MIRNLKALLLAAVAVMAVSAVGASAGQAAEFHSSVAETKLTLTTDGTGKTAHQVFDAAGASITCAGIKGEGNLAVSTATSVTIDVTYEGPCTFVGQEATVDMKGCDYTFTSHGTVSLSSRTGKNCATEPITFSVPSPPCTVTVGSAGGANQNLESVTYHNITTSGVSEITVEPHVTGITYTATGSGCPETGTKTNGNYTTGNTIVTGSSAASSMVNIFWE